VYAPRQGNDRLLLGLKGCLNEYELDLLRQRSLSARYEKAKRGELVVGAPIGFLKAGDRLEKDPDRGIQEAITLVFDRVTELALGRVADVESKITTHDAATPTRPLKTPTSLAAKRADRRRPSASRRSVDLPPRRP
jgi:DNA invertase Pin-like site-specific DNA recombinase